jgi:hypothetical protein
MIAPIMSGPFDETTLLPAHGDIALGIKGPVDYATTIKTKENEDFIKAYKAKYKEVPDINVYMGYIAALVAVQAMNAAGGDAAPEKLRDTLRGLTYQTPSGPLKFSPEGVAIHTVYIVENAKIDGNYVWKVIYHCNDAGELHGLFATYRNDILFARTCYVNGKISGLKVEYVRGILSYEEEYLDGLRHGYRKLYNERGILVQEAHFMRNRLHGFVDDYDENGKIIFYQTRAIYKKDETPAKYLSKVGGNKSIYGISNIDQNIDYLFMFEGPIDAMFVKMD